MRHRKAGRKLNRTSSHRDAMFRNMVTSLFSHGHIRTTDAKAKELRGWADHMVTLAKRGDLHARRQALAVMRDKAVVHKLFEEAAERFGDRTGGYTNVVKVGRRRGDAAPISLVELISSMETKERKKKKPKEAKKAEAKPKKKTPAKPKEKKKPKKQPETKKEAGEKALAKGKKKAAPQAEQDSREAETGSKASETPETEGDKKEE